MGDAIVIGGIILGIVLIVLSYVKVKFNAIISCILALVVVIPSSLLLPEFFPWICAIWTMYRMLPLAPQTARMSGVETNTYLIFGTLLEERIDHRGGGFMLGSLVGFLVAAFSFGIAFVALMIQEMTGIFIVTTIYAVVLFIKSIIAIVKAFRG